MTKEKAIEILNQRYDEYVFIQRLRFSDESDVINRMIALLTAIDALEQDSTVEAEPDNGWISVKDRMPEEGVDVLVYLNRKDADVDFVDRESGNFFYYDEGEVTHWRPLPEPPKESDEE